MFFNRWRGRIFQGNPLSALLCILFLRRLIEIRLGNSLLYCLLYIDNCIIFSSRNCRIHSRYFSRLNTIHSIERFKLIPGSRYAVNYTKFIVSNNGISYYGISKNEHFLKIAGKKFGSVYIEFEVGPKDE